LNKNAGESHGPWPPVAVIILNWNTWSETLECLESLQRLNYPNFRLILIDNGSTGDSVDQVKAWCEGKIPINTKFVRFSSDLKPVNYVEYTRTIAEVGGDRHMESGLAGLPSNRGLIIIRSSENLGFSGGSNIGLRYAHRRGFPYSWLINNDVVVDGNALAAMVELFRNDDQAGMVGSKILYYERPDVVQWIGSDRILNLMDKNLRAGNVCGNSVRVKWLGAASLMVRNRVISEIGFLDEAYFLYGEDKDWCHRAYRKGWMLYCALNSVVWHRGGASSCPDSGPGGIFDMLRSHGSLPTRSLQADYYDSRNSMFWAKRTYPLFFPIYLVGRTGYLIARMIVHDRHRVHRTRAILRGVWHGFIGKTGRILNPS